MVTIHSEPPGGRAWVLRVQSVPEADSAVPWFPSVQQRCSFGCIVGEDAQGGRRTSLEKL